MLRILIEVPDDAPEDHFVRAVPNVGKLLEDEFDAVNKGHATEIGIRRVDSMKIIDVTAMGMPNGKDGLARILDSVITTFGHQYGGTIRDKDTGLTHVQKVFIGA